MPTGETADGVTTIVGLVAVFGGGALGLFVRSFIAGFRAPEKTEERRVVLETADIADVGGLRGMGNKLTEMYPAVLSTSKEVAKAVLILEAQERRADVVREAQRLRDEERRNEERSPK